MLTTPSMVHGKLLNEKGEIWKPAAPVGRYVLGQGSNYSGSYIDTYLWNYLFNIDSRKADIKNGNLSGVEKAAAYQDLYQTIFDENTNKIRKGVPAVAGQTVSQEEYSPFRVLAMQWTYKANPRGSDDMKLLPVYDSLPAGPAPASASTRVFACIFDLKWNPYPNETTGSTPTPQMEFYPRCQRNFMSTMPRISPYGKICYFKISAWVDTNNNGIPDVGDNHTLNDLVSGGGITQADVDMANRVVPLVDADKEYCVDEPAPHAYRTFPQRMKKLTYNDTMGTPFKRSDDTLDMADLNKTCDELLWWTCRKPFNGVLSRIDALFNSVLGDDSAKNIGALALALMLWGAGLGFLLSVLVMMGVLTMFIAVMQIIWTYVTAVLALTFLLMLSPVFISCALFNITEKFFKNWLAACISYAMQPFLVLAFLFMLSNLTTTDKLLELTKGEVTTKQYFVDTGGENSTKIVFNAPALKHALYEVPYDYYERFYFADEVRDVDPTKLYISGAQRQQYLLRKGNHLLAKYISEQAGISAENMHEPGAGNELDGQQTLKQQYEGIWNLMNKGEYTHNGNIIKTHRRGPDALAEYRIKVGAGNQYTQFIIYYLNNLIPVGNPNADNYAALEKLYKYGRVAALDDLDSFVGEPKGTDNFSEFPECRKNCPQFRPAYNVNNASTLNPMINGMVSDTWPDGSKCGDANNDGEPDICAPNAVCLSNCSAIPGGGGIYFKSLFQGILMWILLNIVVSAFVSKIGQLAQALSRWENYSAPVIHGTSRGVVGHGAWSQSEAAGVYHGGGAFSLGLLGGQAGAIPKTLETMGRVARGKLKKLDANGSVVEGSYMSSMFQKGGGANNKAMAAEDRKARAVAKLKEAFGIDEKKAMKNDSDSKVLASRVEAFVGKQGLFASLRPEHRTGMTHAEIWKVIEEALRDHGGNISEDSLERIKGLVREKIETHLQSKKNLAQ